MHDRNLRRDDDDAATRDHPESEATTPPVARARRLVACGNNRWLVKILADTTAGTINLTPAATTVTALSALPRPTGLLPNSTRLSGVERQVYRVRALVRQVLRRGDKNWHLVLADPADLRQTMIGEIPDSGCASPDRGQTFAAARRALQAMPEVPSSSSMGSASSIGSTGKWASRRTESSCTRYLRCVPPHDPGLPPLRP